MTTEEFQAKYRLLHQLSERGAHTHLASGESGAIVMVHLLDVGPEAATRELLGALDRVEPEAREKVLKVLDVDGSKVVVTKFIMDFVSLPDWLEASGATIAAGRTDAADAASSPPATDAPEEPPVTAPPLAAPPEALGGGGEFTAAFRSVAPVEPPETGSPPRPTPPPAPAEEPAAPVEREQPEGEFTRMFRAAAEPPASAAPVEPEPAPVAPPESAEPLERLEPLEPREPEQAAPIEPPERAEPIAPQPGEFTAMFRAAMPSAEEPKPDAPAPAAPARPADLAEGPPSAGEFTRMFRAASTPTGPPGTSEPPTPEPPAPAQGEFTGSFAAHADPAATRPSWVIGSPPEQPGPPAREVEPPREREPSPAPAEGEFTRMFRAASSPAPGPSMGGSAPPPAPPGREEPRVPPPLPPPASTPQPGGGEFTGRFQAFSPNDAPPPAPPSGYRPPPELGPTSSDGYLERLRGASSTHGRADSPVPPGLSGPPPSQPVNAPPLPWGNVPSAPPAGVEPGAYTRMIAAQQLPPPPALPRTAPGLPGGLPPMPAPAARAPLRLSLVLGLVGVAFVAFALILFLVLKSQLAPPQPATTGADSVPAAATPGKAAEP